MRGVGVLVGEHLEVEALGSNLAREIFQRLDFRRRQAEPAQAIGAGAARRLVVEWIERGGSYGTILALYFIFPQTSVQTQKTTLTT